MAQQARTPFRGYTGPNFTPVPDQLFDEQLADLSGAELKVLLYIMRRTFGFKRDADAISLSQMLHGIAKRDGQPLDKGTGLSKPTLLQTLRSLVEKQIVIAERRRSKEKGDEPTVYRLNIIEPGTDGELSRPVVKKFYRGVVKESPSPVVKKPAPQETVIQKTEPSIYRKATPIGEEGKTRATNYPVVDRTTSQRIESVGAVLQRHRVATDTDNREARRVVESAVREFAREFGDRASTRASTTRAINLMRASGRSLPAFVSTLYEARAITRDRLHGSGGMTRNPMGYFFAVIADLLGLRADGEEHAKLPTAG